MTDVFFSHIFVPSLRPLLENLGVPLVLSHPGEMKEWQSEESEHDLALFTNRYPSIKVLIHIKHLCMSR